MTAPDPERPDAPANDDDTSAYDAAAARADATGSEATPRPDPESAPWPPEPDPHPGPGHAPTAPPPAVPPPVPTAPSAGGVSPAPGALTGPTSNPPVGTAATAGPPPGSVPVGAPPTASPPSWAPPPSQRSSTPAGLVLGVILVVVGGALLLGQVVNISLAGVTWPTWVVVPGVAMLVGSFFIPGRGGVGLAIAGTIVTIVGLILWVQDAYDAYSTWAYAWALVAPFGPGLGMFLYGLVHRDGQLVGTGFRTMLVGLGLFLGFALFFEGVIGLSSTPIANLDQVLPYAIVGLGVLLVVLSFTGRRDAPTPPR